MTLYRIRYQQTTPITRVEQGRVILEGYQVVSDEIYEADYVELMSNLINFSNRAVVTSVKIQPGYRVTVEMI